MGMLKATRELSYYLMSYQNADGIVVADENVSLIESNWTAASTKPSKVDLALANQNTFQHPLVQKGLFC
jgi:hypothetical protein